MMTTKGVVKTCLAFTLIAAFNASAQEMAWTYGDLNYQRTNDSDIDGYSFEISGNMSRNWVLQGRVNQLILDEDQFEVTQTRYDAAVGWIFRFSDNFDALLSGGYTHLKIKTDLHDFGSSTSSDDMANAQFTLRAAIAALEVEGTVGILADDDDASDILWSTRLRYNMARNVSVQFGVYGSEESDSLDDVVFELGFRFDLRDPD